MNGHRKCPVRPVGWVDCTIAAKGEMIKGKAGSQKDGDKKISSLGYLEGFCEGHSMSPRQFRRGHEFSKSFKPVAAASHFLRNGKAETAQRYRVGRFSGV